MRRASSRSTPGLDHLRFAPGPSAGDAALLAPLALPDPPWLLYPAALWAHKNHGALFDALGRTRADLSLVLTGATFGRAPALHATAARAGVEDRVHHLGLLPAPAMPALYRAATAVVFPSLAEGFGQPPLEAMACGCPVASSCAGSLAEAIGEAALAFDPCSPESIADAIDRVTGEAALRETLRAAGLERARNYSWSRAAARHRSIYERAAATSPSVARSR